MGVSANCEYNFYSFHYILDLYGSPGLPLIIYCIIDPFFLRPYIDFQRLKVLGKIEDKDFKKMWKWGGLYSFKYYSTLMFGK